MGRVTLTRLLVELNLVRTTDIVFHVRGHILPMVFVLLNR